MSRGADEVLVGMPLTANLGLFAVSAAIVWLAGTRLARHAKTILR